MNWLHRCVDQFQVCSSSPCPACGADSVSVPAQAPVLGVASGNEGEAEAKTILWWHTARGNVKRMIGEQGVGATTDAHDAVESARIGDAFTFAAKIGVYPAFILGEGGRGNRQE